MKTEAEAKVGRDTGPRKGRAAARVGRSGTAVGAEAIRRAVQGVTSTVGTSAVVLASAAAASMQESAAAAGRCGAAAKVEGRDAVQAESVAQREKNHQAGNGAPARVSPRGAPAASLVEAVPV